MEEPNGLLPAVGAPAPRLHHGLLARRDIMLSSAGNERGGHPDGQPMFNFDFRPHSHHWQMVAKVRADEHKVGTISVGDADIMVAMTSAGDGEFPVHLALDAAGTPTAIVVVIDMAA